jgi:hypothetical protein
MVFLLFLMESGQSAYFMLQNNSSFPLAMYNFFVCFAAFWFNCVVVYALS